MFIKPLPSLPYTSEKFLMLKGFKLKQDDEDLEVKKKILLQLEDAIQNYDKCEYPNLIDLRLIKNDFLFNDWYYRINKKLIEKQFYELSRLSEEIDMDGKDNKEFFAN